jgi:hypothetical protein
VRLRTTSRLPLLPRLPKNSAQRWRTRHLPPLPSVPHNFPVLNLGLLEPNSLDSFSTKAGERAEKIVSTLPEAALEEAEELHIEPQDPVADAVDQRLQPRDPQPKDPILPFCNSYFVCTILTLYRLFNASNLEDGGSGFNEYDHKSYLKSFWYFSTNV